MQANDDYPGKTKDFKQRKSFDRELTMEELVEKQLESNFRIMEQIRARVDQIVEDPKTAAALKPYYPYGCKRPTFHDEYLPTFNQPHVTLSIRRLKEWPKSAKKGWFMTIWFIRLTC